MFSWINILKTINSSINSLSYLFLQHSLTVLHFWVHSIFVDVINETKNIFFNQKQFFLKKKSIKFLPALSRFHSQITLARMVGKREKGCKKLKVCKIWLNINANSFRWRHKYAPRFWYGCVCVCVWLMSAESQVKR